ncbi:MAG: glutathione-disulfide reductase [Hyphomicrobiaceae bacterium]|nr:glutathione-disulfide reductase [Hyphomicrobiaceae bacterium]
MAAHDFDLFVIGGGSGGVRAARIAASHGARVGLAEEFRYGGTCVIRGCVPKKLLVYASRFRDDFEDARGFGWSAPNAIFDWPSLIAAKDKEIDRLEAAYQGTLQRAGVTMFSDHAELVSPHAIKLKTDGRTITAAKILIATGGTPSFGETIPGLEHVITSNEAFHLKALPRRIVIYGGGYIAIEFAGIFAGLGAETTIVYRSEKILRGFDEDLRDGLTEALQKRGVRIVTNAQITGVEKIAGGLTTKLSTGDDLVSDQVMFAIGRVPNVEGMGLGELGVERGWNGHIVVDEFSRSSVENIFAVGDVTDRVNLTPVAIREGHAFADTQFGNKPWSVDHELIPTAVFSTPEIGTIGHPEHIARERNEKIDIYKTSFRPMRNVLAGRDERTMMKLIVCGDSGKILGCHVLGPDAAEIVQMAAVAIRLGATKADFDQTMALHPSAGEELLTMRDKWIDPS